MLWRCRSMYKFKEQDKSKNLPQSTFCLFPAMTFLKVSCDSPTDVFQWWVSCSLTTPACLCLFQEALFLATCPGAFCLPYMYLLIQSQSLIHSICHLYLCLYLNPHPFLTPNIYIHIHTLYLYTHPASSAHSYNQYLYLHSHLLACLQPISIYTSTSSSNIHIHNHIHHPSSNIYTHIQYLTSISTSNIHIHIYIHVIMQVLSLVLSYHLLGFDSFIFKGGIFSSLLVHELLRHTNVIYWFLHFTLAHSRSLTSWRKYSTL